MKNINQANRKKQAMNSKSIINRKVKNLTATALGALVMSGGIACAADKPADADNFYKSGKVASQKVEFNNQYKAEYEAAGMKCVGVNPESDLVEIVEIPKLKWFVGTQFHPEYSSTVLNPHPLFVAFIKASVESFEEKEKAKK